MSPLLFNGVSVPPDSYNLFVILTHEYKNIWDDMKNQISGMISSCMFWASVGAMTSTLTIKQIRYEMATADGV
jgi:hypothetical protein